MTRAKWKPKQLISSPNVARLQMLTWGLELQVPKIESNCQVTAHCPPRVFILGQNLPFQQMYIDQPLHTGHCLRTAVVLNELWIWEFISYLHIQTS